MYADEYIRRKVLAVGEHLAEISNFDRVQIARMSLEALNSCSEAIKTVSGKPASHDYPEKDAQRMVEAYSEIGYIHNKMSTKMLTEKLPYLLVSVIIGHIVVST